MSAAASGRRRVENMSSQAEALDSQARQLAAKAAALRGVADKVRLGNEGELQIASRLDVLDGAGWHVLHDRRKNARSPANLDHVIIGPPGVMVIDAKNWSGGLLKLDDRGMKLGGWRKDDALHAARVDAELVQCVARAVMAVPCVGVLAFVQDVGLQAPVLHRNVVLLQQAQLVPWLTKLPRALTVEQVDQLGAHLQLALAPRSATAPDPAPATAPRPQWAQGPKQILAPTKKASRAEVKREAPRREMRKGLLGAAALAVVALTFPTTFPVAQEHVLTPLAELVGAKLQDVVQQPVPPAPPPP